MVKRKTKRVKTPTGKHGQVRKRNANARKTAKSRRNALDELSSKELQKMADAKKREEEAVAQQKMKEELAALRKKRKVLEAQFRKELRSIDKEIDTLKGKQPGGKKPKSMAQQITAMLSRNSAMAVADIRGNLERRGYPASSLPQTLAYMKKAGKVEQPQRGVYKLAS